MGKIICDVCGTSYPDTTEQCPICGCVRSAEARVVSGAQSSAENGESGTYTHVKGGRFSKTNVKKRNFSKSDKQDNVQQGQKGKKPGKGLVIAVLSLLLCIIAVSVYITIRFDPLGWFAEEKPYAGTIPAPVNKDVEDKTPDNQKNEDESQQGDSEQEDNTPPQNVACTSVKLSVEEIQFVTAGETAKIEVSVEPEDTTDPITYTSDNESVVTVDSEGNVTAKGNGEAVITVTCGELSASCAVTCTFQKPDVRSEPSKGNALVDDQTYKLNTFGGGRDFYVPANNVHELTLKDENGEYLEIVIEENSAYCTVEKNIIKVSSDAPSSGAVTIYVIYGEEPGDYIECTLRF